MPSATPPCRAGVKGDPVRLRQIVANFIGNAVKFTEQGWIELRAPRASRRRPHPREVCGPGIAREVQPRLFHLFSQADASTTRRYGGTGLA